MKFAKYRWFVLFLIFVATTINYLDRQIIGLLKPTLETEFGWTETEYAKIVMGFTAAYAIGLMVFGRFVDKVGTKLGYAVSIIIWSVAGIAHAFARTVGGFIGARILLGLGEAGNFPAGMKAISENFNVKERGLATGIFNAGTSFGVVTALLIVPTILANWGWKEVFWITGAFGFVWLIFWQIFYVSNRKNKYNSDPNLKVGENGAHDTLTTDDLPGIKWVKLFSLKQTWAIIVGKFFIDPIYWFFLFWLPSYFVSSFKLDLTKPSPELMVIYASTTLGSIFGGVLSSYLIKKGWAVLKARRTALLIFALLETSILLLKFASSAWIAVAIISFAIAIHQAWATNIFTMAADMFPRRNISSVVGIAGTAGALGGILFPMFIGYILDVYKNAGSITDGYRLIFTICGCTYFLAWVLIYFLTKKIRA